MATNKHITLISAALLFCYLTLWFFFNGSTYHMLLNALYHLALLVLIASLYIFERAEIGSIQKMNISSDRDNNVIGQMLYLMQAR